MVFTVDEIIQKSPAEASGVSFEDALNETKFGKFHYCLIFVSGIFMASVFWETMGVNYVLPVAECDLNISTKQQYGIVSGVWFVAIYFIFFRSDNYERQNLAIQVILDILVFGLIAIKFGFIVTSVDGNREKREVNARKRIILTSNLWGFVSDTYGRRNVLIISTLAASFASVLSSLAANLLQLAFFRFLNGICLSGTSTIFAYLGEFLNAKRRSGSTMFSAVIFGGLCLFLPITAMLLINQKWSFFIPVLQVTYKPWRFFLLVCGFPSLISGLSLFFFPESPKFTFSQGDEAKTINIFRKMYYINTGKEDYRIDKIKPNEEFEQKHERKHVLKMMFEQSLVLFRDYTRPIILVSMIQFGMYFVCNGMLLFFPDIVNQRALYLQTSSNVVTLCKIIKHTNEARRNISTEIDSIKTCVEELDISAYYYSLILEGCYTGGFFLLSILVNYVGRLTIFTSVLFSTGICGFLIVWIQNSTVAIYLYVWLLACGVIAILLNTVTYELFPTNLRALALSVSVTSGRLASLVGGNIAGLLLEAHCSGLYIFSGVILVFSGILTFFIPNIRQKK